MSEADKHKFYGVGRKDKLPTASASEVGDFFLREGSSEFSRRMSTGNGATYKRPMDYRKLKRKLERERQAEARKAARKKKK
jgi:hypothetical protein